MKPRIDEHAYLPPAALAALGLALIRLGIALRPTKENA